MTKFRSPPDQADWCLGPGRAAIPYETRASYMRPMTLKTTDTPGGQVVMLSDVDREMLAALPADERDLIERVLRQDSKVTVEKAIEVLRAFSI